MNLKHRVAWACLDLQSKSAKHFNAYICNTDQDPCMFRLEAPTLHWKDSKKQQPWRPMLLKVQSLKETQQQSTPQHHTCCAVKSPNPWPMMIHLCLQPLTFSTTIHTDALPGFDHCLKHPAWINWHDLNSSNPLTWPRWKGTPSKRRQWQPWTAPEHPGTSLDGKTEIWKFISPQTLYFTICFALLPWPYFCREDQSLLDANILPISHHRN